MLTNTNNTNGNTTKNPTVVIGIDHGYGNIKTANTCFRAGVTAYDKEPFFILGALQYNGKWYGISEEHKEFILPFAWLVMWVCIYDQMNQMTAAPDKAAISVKGMPMRTKSLVDTL